MKKIIIVIFFSFNKTAYGQILKTYITCDTLINVPSAEISSSTGGFFRLTITSANNTRIGYSINYYNSNYGDIYLYDGPTNNSPLLAHYGDPFSIPNQVFGGKSTSNSITLFFPARLANDPMHFNIKVRCIAPTTGTAIFQPLTPLKASGNLKAEDYDKDGDKDLIIGGEIFRNDSYYDSAYKFQRSPGIIDNWKNVNVCSSDFDNDGFKDIFITGSANITGVYAPSAAVYRNNGNATFSLVTSQSFIGATRGGCSVADLNNDGKLDICYTGSTDLFNNNNLVFKTYLNNGNMIFRDTIISLQGITGLLNASFSWADYDNDGDKDMLINGHKGNINVSALFIRSGNAFVKHNLNITPTSMGSLAWVDVNMDGKIDIFNTGVNTPDNVDAIVPEIYFNTGNNNFVLTPSNLPRLPFISSDWSDYDKDNDQDLVLGGWSLPTGSGYTIGVYKNMGNGQFVKASSLDGASEPTRLRWYDFNNDAKPDVIGGGYFYKNMGLDSFKNASFSVTHYNNYPNTTIYDDFNNDGSVDIFIAGDEIADVDCNRSNTSALVIGRGWQFSPIPQFTSVAKLASLNPYSSLGPTYFRWADFDSDGLLDVIAAGYNNPNASNNYFVVLKNNGNNNFTLFYDSFLNPLPIPPGLPFVSKRYIGMFDIDNDGINELFACPSIVYKRNGTQWEISSSISSNVTTEATYMDFADYDKDGLKDVVINSGNTLVYKNNGAGKMINISSPLPGYTTGILASGSLFQTQWVDFDNDGDADILTSRGILENRNANFEGILNPVPEFIHAEMGDLNNDGYKDLLTYPGWFVTNNGPMKLYLSQQGTGFFEEKSLGPLTLQNVSFSSNIQSGAAIFDIDNDGDQDFVYSPNYGCALGPQVVVNEGNSFSEPRMHVISPNGGETLVIYETANIKWYGKSLPGQVKIEISRDKGNTWETIANSAPSTINGGSYSWRVSGPSSQNCLIKISANTLTDLSNATFAILNLPPLVANAGSDITICNGGSVTLGNAPINGITYNWTNSNNSFTSSIANPLVSPIATTSYYLLISNGIQNARDTVIIAVSNSCKDIASLYPNPVNNLLTIKIISNTTLPVRFILMNAAGLTVTSEELNNTTTYINTLIYQNGIYFYSILSPGGTTLQTGSLVIVH